MRENVRLLENEMLKSMPISVIVRPKRHLAAPKSKNLLATLGCLMQVNAKLCINGFGGRLNSKQANKKNDGIAHLRSLTSQTDFLTCMQYSKLGM